jgi:hypothetical protein
VPKASMTSQRRRFGALYVVATLARKPGVVPCVVAI